MDRCSAPRLIDVVDLGVLDYQEALDIQIEYRDKRISGVIPDTLLIVEHFPVVTTGRFSESENILNKGYFNEQKIPFVSTGRGGRITYHGPGQVMFYPIIDLSRKKKDISSYIDLLEKVVVMTLRSLGVLAERDTENRGVWVGKRKVAFIGVAFKKWVSYHGVSVNINNEIDPFLHIRPCGENNIRVTSVKEVLGHEIDVEVVKKKFYEHFSELEIEHYRSIEICC